jgi:hypothetical protein
MNRFFSAALLPLWLLPQPAPAQDLRASATRFCNAARQINAKGMSAAPGSMAGTMITNQAMQTPAQYRQLWLVAKALNIPACNAMW